jgi:hypothetical protein
MSDKKENEKTGDKITVAGVTFRAEDVISAVVKIEGREIEIKAKKQESNVLGFCTGQ